jgi:pentatricopeptide repeat protein
MIRRSLRPNIRTYISLILALTERDYEVHKAIGGLDGRVKRRKLLGRQEVAMDETDKKRIEQLKAENNFVSAMSMFDAALNVGARNKFPLAIYTNLLRSCAFQADVDAAIRVFAQLESRTDFLPGPQVFLNLLSVYANANDLQGAKEVFQEFREASKAGRIRGIDFSSAPEAAVASSITRGQLLVWNKMIEAYFRGGQPAGALRILETMMDSNVNPAELSPEVPLPSSSTFSSIIAGFCYSGDVKSALSWFDRLLQQGEAARHPHESSLVPPRPDQLAWVVMLDFLAQEGMIADLNRLYGILVECAPRDGLEVRRLDHTLVLEANINYLQSGAINKSGAKKNTPAFKDVLKLIQLANNVNVSLSKELAVLYLNTYMSTCNRGDMSEYDIGLREHEVLLSSALAILPADMEQIITVKNHAYKGLIPLLIALSKQNLQLSKLKASLISNLSDALYASYSKEQRDGFFRKVSSDFRTALEKPSESRDLSPSPVMQMYPPIKDVIVDGTLSRYVDDWFPSHPTVTIHEAYRRLQDGIANSKYVHPSTLGRLINGFGRVGDLDKVHSLYDIAQIVLSSIDNKQWQSQAWFQIEDQMIIACAHAGDMEAAFQHRDRMTSNGGIPSPDAYGSLIECVKDTTDDTSNAMALFSDAQMIGCTPNVYLYNTIISKLAKARKADFALELFQQMKATPGVRPSSITYGAVIAACARVGDAQSAEHLFLEMSSQPNFKPRIPPYNMMMQLYAHTKPDRERVLHYHNQLLLAGVKPSAHTYKVCHPIVSSARL